MRTTLDLPDAVFRQLKSRAALEGVSLKDLIARLVTTGLRASADRADRVSEAPAAAKSFVSVYDLIKDDIGIMKGGPSDLATNPKHMEGFGRD